VLMKYLSVRTLLRILNTPPALLQSEHERFVGITVKFLCPSPKVLSWSGCGRKRGVSGMAGGGVGHCGATVADHVATRRARVFYELSQHSVNSWGFVILEAREAPALCVLGHLGQFPLLHMCCVCVVHSEMLSSGAWHPASAPACL